MSAHTPGPWRFDAQSNVIQGEGGEFIADMNGVRIGNVPLMAAAPDLLDALTSLWKAYCALECGSSRCHCAISDTTAKTVRDSIAKAEGRS